MKINVKSDSLRQKLNVAGVILIFVAIIGSAAGLTIYVNSNTAVNEYVSNINKQYSELANSNSTDNKNVKPVQLQQVMLADLVNPKYRHITQLTSQYDKLLERLVDYQDTLSIHNKLVKILNEGLDGDDSLSGQALDLARQNIEIYKKHYPKASEAISSLQQLEAKISESTKFSEISTQMHSALSASESWLQNERNAIESARNDFRQAINQASGATKN